MKRSLIASLIVTTIAVSTAATVCGDKASLSQLSLLDLEGKSVNFYSLEGANHRVIREGSIFIAPAASSHAEAGRLSQ